MTINSAPDDLLKKIEAFKLLFEREPEITAIGPFDDIDGEAVFGYVKVLHVGTHQFRFEADGEEWSAEIAVVTNGFYLQ